MAVARIVFTMIVSFLVFSSSQFVNAQTTTIETIFYTLRWSGCALSLAETAFAFGHYNEGGAGRNLVYLNGATALVECAGAYTGARALHGIACGMSGVTYYMNGEHEEHFHHTLHDLLAEEDPLHEAVKFLSYPQLGVTCFGALAH
jgi:hypothetical protein